MKAAGPSDRSPLQNPGVSQQADQLWPGAGSSAIDGVYNNILYGPFM
jgi:hypothetical protein